MLLSFRERHAQDSDGQSLWIIFLIAGGCLFLGWGVGKRQAWEETKDWIIELAATCEEADSLDEFGSVANCIENDIVEIEEERRAEKAASADPWIN